jgi:hypothetical protein
MEVGKDWEEGVRAGLGGEKDGGKSDWEEGVRAALGGQLVVRRPCQEGPGKGCSGGCLACKLTGWNIDKANICLYY